MLNGSCKTKLLSALSSLLIFAAPVYAEASNEVSQAKYSRVQGVAQVRIVSAFKIQNGKAAFKSPYQSAYPVQQTMRGCQQTTAEANCNLIIMELE